MDSLFNNRTTYPIVDPQQLQSQIYHNWSLVIINLCILCVFLLIMLLSLNEVFIRRFYQRRPHYLLNQRGLLGLSVAIQSRYAQKVLDDPIGGDGQHQLASLSQNLNPKNKKHKRVKIEQTSEIGTYQSKTVIDLSKQQYIENILSQWSSRKKQKPESVDTSQISDISYQQQIQDFHQDYFERTKHAYSEAHGGFYEEHYFQRDDIYSKPPKKEDLPQQQPIQEPPKEEEQKEEKKEDLHVSQPLDDIEIEERRISNMIGTNMGSLNSKLFSGIMIKGSSNFLSNQEDYLQFQMSSRPQQMRKQPGFMKTGDEFSFFSKSQQSLNP